MLEQKTIDTIAELALDHNLDFGETFTSYLRTKIMLDYRRKKEYKPYEVILIMDRWYDIYKK